jgi:hypothetical protein
MEMGVVLPARLARNTEDAEAARLVRAIQDQVIVLDKMFEIEIVGALYFERKLLLGRQAQWSDLSRTLARHGVHRFTHLARYPTTTPHLPEYRRAEVWGSGRFILSRWVLETSASP